MFISHIKMHHIVDCYFSLSLFFLSTFFHCSLLHLNMVSISRTWRRISYQFKTNLRKKGTLPMGHKRVRFNTVDTVFYTHSPTEYDRTPLSNEEYSSEDEL
ncbi:hypothetical protein BD560DRAFT_392374 [Blakeslea trispora]|nr:hypothetical protein BD560DRAFT_392374 [Blakeslea trispora]